MIYYKRYTGKLLPQKTAAQPSWVQWTHHSEGKTHCEECLMLDGCWFLEGNAPPCPHHPYCHCTLDPISYAMVLMNATSYSDYRKFDPYLFDPENTYRHGKIEHLKVGAILFRIPFGLKTKSRNRRLKSTYPVTICQVNQTDEASELTSELRFPEKTNQVAYHLLRDG